MTKMLILFHSQEYGNTEAMAKAIAKGAKESGAKTTLINTNNKRINIEDFRKFDVVAFGTPDYWGYIAGGLKTFVDDFYIARKANREGLFDKPYGLFYSHGGGGSVREPFENLFRRLKIGSKVGKTIEAYGQPGSVEIEECYKLGRQLAETIKK